MHIQSTIYHLGANGHIFASKPHFLSSHHHLLHLPEHRLARCKQVQEVACPILAPIKKWSLETLPPELLEKIFSSLSLEEVSSASLIPNRTIHRVALDTIKKKVMRSLIDKADELKKLLPATPGNFDEEAEKLQALRLSYQGLEKVREKLMKASSLSEILETYQEAKRIGSLSHKKESSCTIL